MIDGLRFHHIGVAVFNIDATAALYEQGGYRRSASIFDPVQNVNICWLTKDNEPTVELLAPVDENSPVNKTLEKLGVSPYHCCYVVDNVEDAVTALRKRKYILVSKPVEAVAFNGSRVCFMYNKSIGLIELAEAPADILDTPVH